MAALPSKSFFYRGGQIYLGTGAAEYGFLPQAHNDGDLHVLLPERDALRTRADLEIRRFTR